MKDASTFAVIIAGGAGTRLWPLSRRDEPKPFLPTKDGRSLLTATLHRAQRFANTENVLTVVARPLAEKVAHELPALPRENILGEPTPRNTAAAIGLAATVASQRDPEALLAILPADHVIADEGAFQAAAMAALSLARAGEVVTLGIEPTRPETGYGYLWLGEPLGAGYRLRRFVEKPSREKAEAFLASGDHLWNSGTFFFSARRILEAMEAHLPALAAGLRAIAEEAARVGVDAALDAHFASLPSISIDYGIMEELPQIACVRVDCGWDDVGTLSSYAGLASTRAPLEIGASNNLALGVSKKVIAVVGADDLIIVETADALVICKRQESQRIKDLVELLQKKDPSLL